MRRNGAVGFLIAGVITIGAGLAALEAVASEATKDGSGIDRVPLLPRIALGGGWSFPGGGPAFEGTLAPLYPHSLGPYFSGGIAAPAGGVRYTYGEVAVWKALTVGAGCGYRRSAPAVGPSGAACHGFIGLPVSILGGPAAKDVGRAGRGV